MAKVLHVKTDGTSSMEEVHDLEDGQRLVGGLIEHIPFLNGISLWINEEGMLIEGMRPNFAVTWLLMLSDPNRWANTLIYGNAYFSGFSDERGMTTDVPEDFLDRLKGVLT